MTKPTNEQTHSINALLLNLNDVNTPLIEKAKLCRETFRQADPVIVQALNDHLKKPESAALKKLLVFVHELDKKSEQSAIKARHANHSAAPDRTLSESDRLRYQLIEDEAKPLLDMLQKMVNKVIDKDPGSYTKLRACFVTGSNSADVLGQLKKVAKEQSGFSLTQSTESAAIYKAILNFKIGDKESQTQSLETIEKAKTSLESSSISQPKPR